MIWSCVMIMCMVKSMVTPRVIFRVRISSVCRGLGLCLGLGLGLEKVLCYVFLKVESRDGYWIKVKSRYLFRFRVMSRVSVRKRVR